MLNNYLDLVAYFGIGGAHPGGFTLSQSILMNENIQPFESVLDIGCGTGQTADYLAARYGAKPANSLPQILFALTYKEYSLLAYQLQFERQYTLKPVIAQFYFLSKHHSPSLYNRQLKLPVGA